MDGRHRPTRLSPRGIQHQVQQDLGSAESHFNLCHLYNHLNRSLSQSYIYTNDPAGLLNKIGIEDNPGGGRPYRYSGIVCSRCRGASTDCAVMAGVGSSTSLHFVFSELITQTANHSTVENSRAVEPGCLYYFNAEDSFNNVLFKD